MPNITPGLLKVETSKDGTRPQSESFSKGDKDKDDKDDSVSVSKSSSRMQSQRAGYAINSDEFNANTRDYDDIKEDDEEDDMETLEFHSRKLSILAKPSSRLNFPASKPPPTIPASIANALPNANPAFSPSDSSIDPEAQTEKRELSPWNKQATFKVPVRIEHSTNILIELVANTDLTLHDLNEMLFKEFPMLDSRPFVYLYRGTAIHQAHWPIYGARAFKNGLELRIVSALIKSRSSIALNVNTVESFFRIGTAP